MRDLSADRNEITDGRNRQSIFDSSKFWGVGPRHKESLSEDIEIHSAKTKKEDLQEYQLEIAKKEDSQEHQLEIAKKEDSQEHQLEITKKEDSHEHLPVISKKEDSHEPLPVITKKEDSQEQIPKNNPKTSKSRNVKLYDTTNGKFIFTRGWDGTNMSVYQIRRKNL